jgi:Flp pilus assembly protein CpaB
LNKKIRVRIIIALAFSLIVAGVALHFLLDMADIRKQEFRGIVTPIEVLPPNQVIREGQVETINFPVNMIDAHSAIHPSQIIGKVPLREINKGEQINLELIVDKHVIDENKHQVSVNINLNRSVGGVLKEGDLVDVYWLKDRDAPPSILAKNSVVLRVSDNEGNNLNIPSFNMLKEKKVPVPAVVVLSVNPSEVPSVIRGSADNDNSIVLVKKLKEGDAFAIIEKEPWPEQDEPEQPEQ